MKIIDFFKMRAYGLIISAKPAGKIRQDIESVTIMRTSPLMINKDAREHLFLLTREQKSATGYTLMPTVKACGIRKGPILPIMTIEINEDEAGTGSVIDYDISPYTWLTTLSLAFLFLFFFKGLLGLVGVVVSGNNDNLLSILMINLFTIALPFVFVGGAFWYPCKRTIKALEWLAETDLDDYRKKKQEIEKVLKEYDQRAGIDTTQFSEPQI